MIKVCPGSFLVLLATYVPWGTSSWAGNLRKEFEITTKGYSPKVGMGLKVKVNCWVVITK